MTQSGSRVRFVLPCVAAAPRTIHAVSHPDAQRHLGILYALAAYTWWGFAPFYFKLVAHVPAMTVLAHRIVWSVILLAALTALLRQWPAAREALRDPRLIPWLTISTLLVATNWLVFIIAVATNRLIDASLGYFINPLVTVLLGMIFLHERLRPRQWLASAIATAAIIHLTIAREGIPWIAIVLAISFGLYSLIRKQAPVGTMTGLFVETLLLAPLALGYVVWSHARTEAGTFNTPATLGLLSLAGIITVAPLLWFVAAARRLPLITIGFLQYLAPSLQFVTAVLIFAEPFDVHRAIAFGLIWLALAIFIGDSIARNRRQRQSPVPPLE